MNREIKFRVWSGYKMVYDITVGKFGVFYVNPMSKGNGLDENDSASITPFNTKYPDGTPIMQSTGFKDKLGTEIYEGDIISYWRVRDYKRVYGDVVSFDEKVGAWYCGNELLSTVLFEQNNDEWKVKQNYLIKDEQYARIIGNIYETKELTKKP